MSLPLSNVYQVFQHFTNLLTYDHSMLLVRYLDFLLQSFFFLSCNYLYLTCFKKKSSTKQKSMEWEKIFANDVTDKQLISKIYKQFIQFNITETNDSIKNGQRPKQTLLQGGHTGTRKDVQCHQLPEKQKSNPPHNIVSPHISQNGSHQKSTNNKGWKECEEKEPLLGCWNANWCSHYRKQYGGSSKQYRDLWRLLRIAFRVPKNRAIPLQDFSRKGHTS